MLSICIPVFNFSIAELIAALQKEIADYRLDVEIILIDDASTNDSIKQENKKPAADCRYIQLEKNIGRAAIRNLFVEYAQHPHLLFLDCDSLIINDEFLRSYIAQIKNHSNAVICGGRTYPTLKPDKSHLLSWKYGTERESKTAIERAQHPYSSFMTNNFVVPKSVLKTISFNDELRQYGHEDTLFGIELKTNNVPIQHIENSILNGDIESNEAFLEKTRQGIQNLAFLAKNSPYKKELFEHVTLLKAYTKIQPIKAAISASFSKLETPLEKRLVSGKASLRVFNYYKLGTLVTLLND